MNKRLEILDSLRGLAALIVVFHHFLVFNGNAVRPNVGQFIWVFFSFISNLNVEAVLFFFVLSGFCIGLAQKGKLLEDKASVNHYLYRRFKRILPVYWLALIISFIVGLLTDQLASETYHIKNLVGNLVFLQTSVIATDYWFSPYGNNGPLWSLAYEMFFYLFFPVYSLILIRYSGLQPSAKQIFILFIVSGLCIAFNKFIIYLPFLAYLSYVVVWISGYKAAEFMITGKKSELLFAAQLVLYAVAFFFKDYIISDAIYEIIKGLFIASLFYYSIKFSGFWNFPLIKNAVSAFNKILAFPGKGSYALYALHYPVLILMSSCKISLIYQVAVIVCMTLISPILETWLTKQPFLFFKRNYFAVSK